MIVIVFAVVKRQWKSSSKFRTVHTILYRGGSFSCYQLPLWGY